MCQNLLKIVREKNYKWLKIIIRITRVGKQEKIKDY